MIPEVALLLACCRIAVGAQDEAAIRQMLEGGIDWALFARKAVGHGVAGLAGHNLARVAPDMVPDDILDALRMNIEQTRRKNHAASARYASASTTPMTSERSSTRPPATTARRPSNTYDGGRMRASSCIHRGRVASG